MASRINGRRIAVGIADSSFREALRRALVREGARPAVHSTASTLLAALAREAWDACILDVDLVDPELPNLVDRIHDSKPGLPLILVSAHLLAEREAADRQGLPILPLPFRREQLIDALQRAFDPAEA